MSFLRTSVVDGLYKVQLFNDVGFEITNQHLIKSSLYLATSPTTFEYLLDTEGATTTLHPDVFKDVTELYATVWVDGYLFKTYLQTPVKTSHVVATYIVTYKVQTPLVETSSPLLERCSYFMPKWSTAFKNDVSSYSKVVHPIFANLEKQLLKTSKALKNALAYEPTFKKKVALYQALGKVTTEDGFEKRLTYNVENSPVTRVTSTPVTFPSNALILETPETLTSAVHLKKVASQLYIQSPLGSVVTIEGISESNAIVSETFTFNTLVTKCSKYKYKSISSIYSSSQEATVTNTLMCDSDHIYERFDQLPLFTDRDKNLQFPRFNLDGKYLYSSFVQNDLLPYTTQPYTLEEGITNLFITDELDVVALDSNGVLKTGLLKRDLATKMPLLESNNVNDFVSVESVDYETGAITFVVDTKRVYDVLESVAVFLEFESDEGKFYLDSLTNELTTDRVSYVLDRVNHLSVEVNLEDYDYISLILKTEKGDFQASVRNDKIALKEHTALPRFEGLCILNNELYGFADGVHYKLTLHKDYYEMYSGVLVSYDKDLKVQSMKGDSIRV